MTASSQNFTPKEISVSLTDVGVSPAGGGVVIEHTFLAPLSIAITDTQVTLGLKLLSREFMALITGATVAQEGDQTACSVSECGHPASYHLASSGPCLLFGCNCANFLGVNGDVQPPSEAA